MSRFGLRSCADSIKLSQNDKNSSKISKLQKSAKILSKKNQKKQNISSIITEKEPSDPATMTDIATATTSQYIAPISIVCSLPLQKISEVLKKINLKQLSTNDLEKGNKTTGIKIMCLYCDKNFSSPTIQKKHVEKIHTLTKHRRCSSRNSNVQSLHESKHQTMQTPNQTLKHFTGCHYCKNLKGHTVASEKDLMTLFFHLVEHHPDKYFGCKLCVLRFQNEGKLLKHMQCLHKKFFIHGNVKSNDEAHLDVINNASVHKSWKTPHIHKSVSNQSLTSSLPQNITLSSINCSNAIKNKMFSGDEPILSRLGVAQNRLPNNRKGLRLRRDAIIPDMLLKSDQSSACPKVRSKIGKTLQTGEYSDVIFRVPTRTDMSCTFDDDFYEKVVLNVRNNLLFHLDGKIVGNSSLQNVVINVNQSFHHVRSTLVKSPIVSSCEIHAATNISSSTAFPTLLTSEQYGCDVTSTKIKRPITKHSWKWKWDSFKKFKLINEGGKIVKKVKQPIFCLRDLSKLDMWTQLTMRQKNELQYRSDASSSLSKSSTSCCKEEKQILNNQLNSILDTRLLPHIILEQSEQTLIKLEVEDDFDSLYAVANIRENTLSYDEGYFSFLNLLPSYINNNHKQIIILSGEWARPRCYLCMGCGSNFEKLKSLEEHKMFRHTHVYSTHYEIVGRELISSNLLRHFFIPKTALNRYENVRIFGVQRSNVLSKTAIARENISNESPEDESSDSIQSILNSSSTTFSSKHSTDDCDTDTKISSHLNALSPTHSIHSASTIISAQITNQTKHSKELNSYINCTKCNRKCNGVLDLYRHMLDCSGDQIWNMAKKRKYRYYCGSKKRRQCNKYSAIDVKKKRQKSLKTNAGLTDINDPRYSKTKTPPRQRPSDAESIKKMLENLPPKRVCKKILPSLNKTKKTRLLVKRKIFNSHVLKQRRSKSVNQVNLPKTKSKIVNSQSSDILSSADGDNLINLKGESSEAEIHEENTAQNKINTQKSTEIKQNTVNEVCIIKVSEQSQQTHATFNDTLTSSATTLLKSNDESLVKTSDKQNNLDTTDIIIKPSYNNCQINEFLTKNDCSNNDVSCSISVSKNCEKKRSKKINDCIAMLTGKLEQKLKTETHSECKIGNTNEQDKTIGLLSVNKTAKRKTCSRRIVKIDFSNIKSNEVRKDPLQQTEELPEAIPHQNIYKCSEKINSTLNYPTSFPLDIYPLTAPTTSYKQSLCINQPMLSEMPRAINASNSNEIAQNGCYNKPYDLQPVNLNNSIISVISSLPRNTTVLPLVKQHIPTRRQTICGVDGLNFSSNCDNDIEPLDLSRKTAIQLQKPNIEICPTSGNKNQNNQSQHLSSQLLQSKQFYSNLDLLKIPQVKNPLCLNKIDEKPFSQKNTSRRKSCNKTFCEVVNKVPVPTTCANNVKELHLHKKENSYKCKNTLKMDEIVINHIDDAINSVINAEKEKAISRDAKENAQTFNEKESGIDLKKTEANVNIELSNQNKGDVKLDKTQSETFTSLKRSVRSKTIDFIAPDINIFRSTVTPIEIFEEKITQTKDCNNSQVMNNCQEAHYFKEKAQLQENKHVLENTINKIDSVENLLSNREKKTFQTNNNQANTTLNEMNIPCSALSEKVDQNREVGDLMKTVNLTAECTSSINQCISEEKNTPSIEQPNVVLNPIKKQRRRRKNELAAIVADQLLESFKIDKARRDNLKRLENLAYEKSEDLLLTGMLLMSSTKRNAASSQFNAINDKFSNRKVDTIKKQKQDQSSKNKRKPSDCTDTYKSKELSTKTAKEFVEMESDLKKCKKKQVRRYGKSIENDNINNLKTSLESFSFDLGATKQNPENEAKSETNYPETEVNPCSIAPLNSKNSTILRPSILSITLESSIISKTQTNDGKTIVSSRDPRLNKNIHKEENKMDYKCLPSRQRLRSANNADQNAKRIEDAYDIEEDIYLTEIAKNVNQKIMSENEDFIFASDEFEVGSMLQEDSTNKFYRPSTSMSVRSAPNLNEDRSNFDSMDENTNTEIIDMDLDDNLSVYTSFSQDVGRGRGRRRRRRRSILFSRKPKRKCIRDVIEEKFECELCKKTFYAASSLTKHQQTLAHVSKVSEQEYLLSKSNNDKNNAAEVIASLEKQQEVEKMFPLIKKNNVTEISAIRDIGNNSFECIKEKGNFNSFPRLTLNPDERLFFECCNILKGSQTSRTNDLVSNNCMKYTTYEYQEKNEIPNATGKNLNNQSTLSCNKQTGSEKQKNEVYTHNLLRDQHIISTKSNKIEDAANDQNNSINSHISAVTNTTSRFKTKAAMKGYENITSDFNINKQLETKSRSACKLTALAEIALGNENTNSHDLALEQRVSSGFVQLNTSTCVNLTLNDPKNINIYDNIKYQKNNDSQSTTSSKTIMHVSLIAADGQETDKIIIPERPFKNIGLEEKETIKFQKPKSTVSLLNTDDNSVSTVSYSDRDDFDFGSISCDDDTSVRNSISKVEKNNCSNSSSRTTTKTFENKSLIMGRIFKNVTAKKKVNQSKPKINSVQNDPPPPRADLNQIFDELRGNTISKGLDIVNKRVLDTVLPDVIKDDQIKNSSNIAKTTAKKTKNSKTKLTEKRSKNFTKLQSELGMSPEELAKLIDEGQRKSKRRCATNRPKKLVEIWSSDEYEEFLSTKDIFALIEEKEKEEKKRKRKNSTTVLNNIEDKDSSAIESTKSCTLKKNSRLNDEGPNKRPLLHRKISQRKEVEPDQIFKLRKKKTIDTGVILKNSKAEGDSLLENFKRRTKASKLNGDDINSSKKEAVSKTIDKSKSSKNIKGKKKMQTTVSLPRRKRVSSEKLYYWSSSSDEDFGKISTNDQNFESGEQYQKHGWIVGDSHKKLVTLLAIAKGNKKVEKCGVKKETSKKRNLSK